MQTFDTMQEDYLMAMVLCGNAEAVRKVLHHNMNINFNNDWGFTPLNLSVELGHTDCVKVLLENGADPNRKNIRDERLLKNISGEKNLVEYTPLMIAASRGEAECIELLLEYGAEINHTNIDNNGFSAFTYAIKSCSNIQCVIALLRNVDKINLFELPEHEKQKVEIATLILKNVKIANECSTESIHSDTIKGVRDEVEILVQKGTDINAKDVNGDTALHLAVRNKYLESVKLLINNGANIYILNNNQMTVFHEAAEHNYEDAMTLFIQRGADVDVVGKRSLTPLHIVARCGHDKCMKLLLENGASVNANNDENLSPLHLALSSGNILCIKLLIEKGANAFMKSKFGLLPIDIAALGNIEQFEMLLPKDVNETDGLELTAIHVAATHSAECIQVLLERGASVNIRGTEKKITALHLAVFKGHTESLKLLLQCNANVNAKNYKGGTPLHYSACQGRVECMKILLHHGAKVNSRTNTKKTPLHFAVMAGSVDCIQVLIECHCRIDARDISRSTPLNYCVKMQNMDCCKLLLQNGANVFKRNEKEISPLHRAAVNGVQCFKILLLQLNKNSKGHNALTALHIAAAYDEECLKAALDLGGDVNVKDKDGTTPLHVAVQAGLEGCVMLLIHKGADVNITNVVGLTPLHISVTCGHILCMKVLLEGGADVNCFNWKKNTPLHYAASGGNVDCMQVLIQNGADVNAVNYSNHTVLMEAMNMNCIELLLIHGARSSN